MRESQLTSAVLRLVMCQKNPKICLFRKLFGMKPKAFHGSVTSLTENIIILRWCWRMPHFSSRLRLPRLRWRIIRGCCATCSFINVCYFSPAILQHWNKKRNNDANPSTSTSIPRRLNFKSWPDVKREGERNDFREADVLGADNIEWITMGELWMESSGQ